MERMEEINNEIGLTAILRGSPLGHGSQTVLGEKAPVGEHVE